MSWFRRLHTQAARLIARADFKAVRTCWLPSSSHTLTAQQFAHAGSFTLNLGIFCIYRSLFLVLVGIVSNIQCTMGWSFIKSTQKKAGPLVPSISFFALAAFSLLCSLHSRSFLSLTLPWAALIWFCFLLQCTVLPISSSTFLSFPFSPRARVTPYCVSSSAHVSL